MSKNLQSFSIIFLGVCILLGCWIISQSLNTNQGKQSHPQQEDIQVQVEKEEPFRYQMISANETNIIIFDRKSGEYWKKFISVSEGPTDWEMQESPTSPSSTTSRQY